MVGIESLTISEIAQLVADLTAERDALKQQLDAFAQVHVRPDGLREEGMGKFEVTEEVARQVDSDWEEYQGNLMQSLIYALQAFVDRYNLQPVTEPQELWAEGRLPTEAGWYWYQTELASEPLSFYVNTSLEIYVPDICCLGVEEFTKRYPGRWLGKLPTPPVLPRKLERHDLQDPAHAHELMRVLWADQRMWNLKGAANMPMTNSVLNIIKTALILSADPNNTIYLADLYIEEVAK